MRRPCLEQSLEFIVNAAHNHYIVRAQAALTCHAVTALAHIGNDSLDVRVRHDDYSILAVAVD